MKKQLVKQTELKGAMAKAGITVKEMAEKLGYTPSGLGYIINGRVDISNSTMKHIRDYLNKRTGRNYSLEDLFI